MKFLMLICILALCCSSAIAEEVMPDEIMLTFVNVDPGLLDERMKYAQKLLLEEYPQVAFEFVEIPQEQVSAALMAREDDIDILNVSRYDKHAAIESGALLDLSDNDSIREALEQWNNVTHLVTYEDKLYGVPSMIWADFLYAETGLWQYVSSGLVVDNCDWIEFLDAAMEFNGDVNGDRITDIWFYMDRMDEPLWFIQYISTFDSLSEVDFDTDVFRTLAEKYREAANADKIIDQLSEKAYGANVLYMRWEIGSPYEYMGNIMPPPKVDGKMIIPSTTKAFSVNASSSDAEIAVRFLEIYSSVQVQQVQNVYYLEDPTLYGNEYEMLSQGVKDALNSSMAWYGALMPNTMTEELRWSVNGTDYSLMEQYIAREITIDQLIDQLQQKLDMVLWG